MSGHPLPYGRPSMPAAPAAYRGESYYGRAAVKPSPWDWRIGAYMFAAGMAGGSQILAALGAASKDDRWEGMVGNARTVAVVNATVGGLLLISDLRTPNRWYNMLRIFRPTSPMSIGSFVLTGFGALSAATLAGHALGWRRAARAAQIPAALAGVGMTTYTGALLAATSTPAWSVAPRLLGARTASAGMASAAAVLALGERAGGRGGTGRTLDRLALLASGLDLALSLAADASKDRAGVEAPRGGERMRRLSAYALAHALPLGLYALNALARQPSPGVSVAAALSVLAGQALMRGHLLHSGQKSAARPGDYFRLTQPSRDVQRIGGAGDA